MKVLICKENMNQNIHITKRATKYVTHKLQARKEKQKTINFHHKKEKVISEDLNKISD